MTDSSTTSISLPSRVVGSIVNAAKYVLQRRFLLALIVLVGAAGSYYLLPDAGVESSLAPRLVSVTQGDIENTVTAAGKLTSKDWVDVGAQVSGQLETLHVDIGDVVEKGQLLAEIDASVQFAQVNASRASLDALRAQKPSKESQLSLSKLNSERQARMMKEDATSQQDFDNAQTALIQAQASLVQLEAQIIQSEASLSSQEANLGYTKIYAPMNGTVVSISAKEGQTLNANQQAPTILTIADLTVMTVEAEVSEADIGKLKKNMEVYFSTLGGGERIWNSNVRQILPTPTTANNVVLYTVLFDIDNRDGALLSEMTAQVFFVTSAARNVISVPVGALTYIDEGSTQQPGPAARALGNQQGGEGSPRERFANMSDSEREEFRSRMREQRGAGGGAGGGGFGEGGRGGNRSGGERATRTVVFDGSTPRRATVSKLLESGEYETVEVRVGVVSRIDAEVISGLSVGDQVVAGVIQQATTTQAQNQSGSNMRIPRGF